jgi:hypothetical protein
VLTAGPVTHTHARRCRRPCRHCIGSSLGHSYTRRIFALAGHASGGGFITQGREGEWRRANAPGRPALGLRGGSAGDDRGAGDAGAAAVTPGMESACVVGGRGGLSLPAMRDAMLGTSYEKYSR